MKQPHAVYAFFNLGTGEILLILLVVLLLFGAKRLPELARGLGKGINEFRDAVDDSKKQIMDETKRDNMEDSKPNEDEGTESEE
ncbi:MAG: twin-arginine translocase TatA/TatE family subunit [Chloroflexi bacterium]|nr:twin-arginine translocase TatA/TatE family subunit [Chloroflexota bacterium]